MSDFAQTLAPMLTVAFAVVATFAIWGGLRLLFEYVAGIAVPDDDEPDIDPPRPSERTET
jgi:hypothetical protein